MHVLDENMDDNVLAVLRGGRIRAKKIGVDLGRKGMTDEDIISLLHKLKSVTFFTHDVDYYEPRLCHERYCLIYLDVGKKRAVEVIRKVLRHPELETWAQRKGKVIRVHPAGMDVWRKNQSNAEFVSWSE